MHLPGTLPVLQNVRKKCPEVGPSTVRVATDLERAKKNVQVWKNHGILKLRQNHGKIMDFYFQSL